MGETTARYYDVVLTRGPGPDSAFVELENERGEGCSVGAPGGWVARGDGYAVLRIPLDDDDRIKELEAERDKLRGLLSRVADRNAPIMWVAGGHRLLDDILLLLTPGEGDKRG